MSLRFKTMVTPLFTKPSAAIAAGILVIFAVILHLMGRIPWCTCGFGVWSAAWQNSTSQHIADPYSLSHVLHGIIFYGLLHLFARKLPMHTRLLIALLIEVGWEILENTPLIINRYRAATASLDYFGDSILNSSSDVLFALFGFWLAYQLPWKMTLALVLAIELLMLVTIRDNLTLNIIMLIAPLGFIKEWQVAR